MPHKKEEQGSESCVCYAHLSYIYVCVYFGQCWQTSSISLYNARVTIYPLLKLSLMTEVTLLMIILLFVVVFFPVASQMISQANVLSSSNRSPSLIRQSQHLT